MLSARPSTPPPERLHPSLWRGSQLASSSQRCLPTGHERLSSQLPGGGWPLGSLIDLLLAQPGIGELRLLLPALRALGKQRPIVLLRPPYHPHAASWSAAGVSPAQLLWLAPDNDTDALWAAEQILKNGSCGALLYWQTHLRPESLRRLHLAAQRNETLFFLLRPSEAARQASPAPLRLELAPAGDELQVRIVKRRGPAHDQAITVALDRLTFALPAHSLAGAADAPVDQRTSDANQPRRVVPELV